MCSLNMLNICSTDDRYILRGEPMDMRRPGNQVERYAPPCSKAGRIQRMIGTPYQYEKKMMA